jgi:CheY-like chemotaxis protein
MHKLLLADDSVTIQRVIELTFSGEDIQVLAVNDGEQAIARIPLEHPDVVLADIGMPRKGGYDVAAFVKGRADLAHIPVLLLAGAFEPVDQARAEQVKADGVLIKPFEPRQVIERVKELLAAVRAPDSAPSAPEPAEPATVPAAADAPSVKSEPTRSLDELFESLNQALNSTAAAPAPGPIASEPVPAVEPQSDVEPEPFVLDAPIEFEPLAASGNGSTLDDYFDRLTAAFQQTSAPSPRPQPVAARLEEPLTAGPSARVPTPQPADEWPAQEWLSPGGAPIPFERRSGDTNPILEAVTALLSPEADARTVASKPLWRDAPPGSTPPVIPPSPSEAMVEAVTQRVLARLVPEISESLRRLVRHEVARAQRDVH